MSVRTLDQLAQELTRELTWREKELREMAQMVSDRNLSAVRKNILIRAAVALLYAHWEGYVKQASITYLDFVHHQRLKKRDLSLPMLALCARAIVNSATGANNVLVHLTVARYFVDNNEEVPAIPYDNAIRTGNLNYEQFHDITQILGLDLVASETESKAKLIDEGLLGNRNRIAHGEFLLVDEERYLNLSREVTTIISLFHNELLNAALQKRYMRPPAPVSTAEN